MNRTYVLVVYRENGRGKLLHEVFEIPNGEEIQVIHEERGGNYRKGKDKLNYFRPYNRHVSIKGLMKKPGYIYDEWDYVYLVITSADEGDIDVIGLLIESIKYQIDLRLFFEEEVPDCDNCEESRGAAERIPWEELD